MAEVISTTASDKVISTVTTEHMLHSTTTTHTILAARTELHVLAFKNSAARVALRSTRSALYSPYSFRAQTVSQNDAANAQIYAAFSSHPLVHKHVCSFG